MLMETVKLIFQQDCIFTAKLKIHCSIVIFFSAALFESKRKEKEKGRF